MLLAPLPLILLIARKLLHEHLTVEAAVQHAYTDLAEALLEDVDIADGRLAGVPHAPGSNTESMTLDYQLPCPATKAATCKAGLFIISLYTHTRAEVTI